MSEYNFEVGQLVELTGRNLKGSIAFIGLTNFSADTWIGVVLDEECGKNNGTVKGCCYFKCEPKHGIFVRATQLRALELKASEEIATGTKPKKPALSASSTSLLKTTKICAPKEAKHILSSSSQLSLNVVQPLAVSAMTTRSATSAVLTLPSRHNKPLTSPTELFCCAKRSSFVETGFLEILQPQFTLGQPLRSPAFNSSIANHNNNSKECQTAPYELQSKVTALEQELQELRQQRSEDKQRLRELDRLQLNNEKLSEFKTKIMEQHGALQRDLQRSRQETRDANDAKSRCMRELADLSESLEFLTLDKEMAEEKADTLQIELDMANERNEELLLDLDILKAEYEGGLSLEHQGKDNINANIGQLRKLEQHNLRLKQTVISLRDVLTQEKHDLQKSLKELETKNSDIAELKKTKELLSKRIDAMEVQIMDLKEQVDVSLGAEYMVEMLADRKLGLEDRVKALEEEVAELEALEEIHEQIIEGNQELELDLQEEIELLTKSVKLLQQEKSVALETIYERDITIKKFRELVKSLNDKLHTKETSSLLEDINTLSNGEETSSLDYNHVFSLTKANGREIDGLLNAMELKVTNMQIDLLLAFMPDEFHTRGGEYDVIKLLVLLQRLEEKLDIVINSINAKFPSSYECDKDALSDGFTVYRFAFRSKAMFLLRALKMMLQQISWCLKHSDYQLSTQATVYAGEIRKHEEVVNHTLKLLKSGELDENSSTSAFECFLSFLSSLHTNLTQQPTFCDLVDEQQLLLATLETYDVGVDCLLINAELLLRIIDKEDEHSMAFSMLQALVVDMKKFKHTIKTLRSSMPLSSVSFSGLQQNQLQRLKQTSEAVTNLIDILGISTKEYLRIISTDVDQETPSPFTTSQEDGRLWQILSINCLKYSHEVDRVPSSVIKSTTALLQEQVDDINRFINDQVTAKVSNINTVCMRSSSHALLARAAQVKQEFEDVKNIMLSLEAREKEVKTLKYVVKMKQTEYSEMQIRKDMTERNLSKLQATQESTLMAIRKAVELIADQYELRANLIMSSLSKFEEKLTRLEQSFASQQLEQHVKSTTAHNALDGVYTDIDALESCLRHQCRKRRQQQANYVKFNLKQLEPITLPQRDIDETLRKLNEQCQRLKNDWILSHIQLSSNRRTSGTTRSSLLSKSNRISSNIIEEYFRRKPHRAVHSEFGTFPSSELRQLWRH